MKQPAELARDLTEIPSAAKVRRLLDLITPLTEVNPELPPDPEDMNDRRSSAALRAVLFFAADFGEDWNKETPAADRAYILQQNAMDFLGDLAHLCDRQGWDLADLLRRARFHYNEETDSQGNQFQDAVPLSTVQDLDSEPCNCEDPSHIHPERF